MRQRDYHTGLRAATPPSPALASPEHVDPKQMAAFHPCLQLVEVVFLRQDLRQQLPPLVGVRDGCGTDGEVYLRALLEVIGELGLGQQVGRPITLPGAVGQVDLAVQVAQPDLDAVLPACLSSSRRDVYQAVAVQGQPDPVIQRDLLQDEIAGGKQPLKSHRW